MILLFKNPQDQKDYRDVDVRVTKIIHYMAHVAWALEEEPTTVTSIRRDDDSTHRFGPPYRFVDLGLYRRVNNEWMRAWINKRFPYGKNRIETIPALRHGTAPHYHVQVKPLA